MQSRLLDSISDIRKMKQIVYLLIGGLQMRKSYKILLILILCMVMGAPQYIFASQSEQLSTGTVSITMLDVHQGLSILINADGKYMLYDGGGRERSSYVVSYLKQHGINNLTYLIASHYDEDHIAGLVGVLATTTVDEFIRPDYTTDTDIYQSLITMAEKNGCESIYPVPGDTFELGTAEITVLSPAEYGSDDNNNSVAIRIAFGNKSCIITGDAEEESEYHMVNSGLNLDSDIYVAGHHGSASSSSTVFLDAVTPEYTFISCGTDNTYGHPAAETLQRLQAVGTQIFRSDIQGEVTVTYDETSDQLSFSQEPCNDWTPGDNSQNSGQTAEAQQQTNVQAEEQNQVADGAQEYVLNTNTKKFHYPSCSSVSQMKDKNKEVMTATRDDLIEMGYSPCGNCHP